MRLYGHQVIRFPRSVLRVLELPRVKCAREGNFILGGAAQRHGWLVCKSPLWTSLEGWRLKVVAQFADASCAGLW